MSGRTWTVALTPGRGLLFADEQASAGRASTVTSLQSAAVDSARDAGVPPLTQAHVVAEYRPPHPPAGKRRRQAPALFEPAENLLPTAQAAVEALVDAGVLPRQPGCLAGPVMRLGEVTAGSQLVLHITKVNAAREDT